MTARRWLCVCFATFALGAHAQHIADIRQGTNLAVTLSADGQTLVADLLGQLWTLPATGGAARPLTPPDELARHPRFAPNGREVVYQHYDGDQWDLRVLDLDTGASLALTSTPYDEREPDFMADGRSIVFAGNQTGHYCLWRLDAATGVLTQLTEEPGDASFPAVAMQGHVAYVRSYAGTHSLRLLDPNGVARELVAARNPLAAPSWRPGGGVLVFTEHDSAGAGMLKLLLLSEPQVIKPLVSGEDIFDARVSWPSPAELLYTADGQIWRRVLADTARHPVHLFAAVTVQTHAPPTDIALVNGTTKHRALGSSGAASTADARVAVVGALGDLWLAERGRIERLTDDAFAEIDPALTPDGNSVVFASDRSGVMNLWRLELAGRALTQLTFDAEKAFAPAVSPEGRRVAYLTTDGLGPWAPSALRVLDLPGPGSEGARTLARGIVDAERVQWDAEGRTIMVASTAGAIHRFDAASGAASAAFPAAPTEPPSPPSLPSLEWRVAPPPAEPYVVEVGRLFDGVQGEYRRHVDVHVTDGRIAAIVPRATLPAAGKIIDARDATVIPGFVDVHAHHSALGGERLGRAWLAYGVTTVREVSADLPGGLERAESWASGRRLGPRLVVTPTDDAADATAIRSATESAIPIARYPGIADGFAHSLLQQALQLAAPDALSRLPRFLATPSGRHYELALSPQHTSYQDSVSRVIASATVTGSALGAVQGLGAGAAGKRFVARDSGYRTLFATAEQQGWNDASLLASGSALGQTLARLIRAGARVAIGSDAPAVPYGLGLHYELALLAENGIPNDQSLRVATAEGALALGLEREIGTLEQGKQADFVVLSGDPLARITDTLTITAVVKHGVWHDRAALLAGP
jgi:Tol biopolymer transport system component